MCVKEFNGYHCGHCSVPTLRLCPLARSNAAYPPCEIPAERSIPTSEYCHPCSRVIWNQEVLKAEEEHRGKHQRGECMCETIFDAQERARRMVPLIGNGNRGQTMVRNGREVANQGRGGGYGGQGRGGRHGQCHRHAYTYTRGYSGHQQGTRGNGEGSAYGTQVEHFQAPQIAGNEGSMYAMHAGNFQAPQMAGNATPNHSSWSPQTNSPACNYVGYYVGNGARPQTGHGQGYIAMTNYAQESTAWNGQMMANEVTSRMNWSHPDTPAATPLYFAPAATPLYSAPAGTSQYFTPTRTSNRALSVSDLFNRSLSVADKIQTGKKKKKAVSEPAGTGDYQTPLTGEQLGASGGEDEDENLDAGKQPMVVSSDMRTDGAKTSGAEASTS